MTISTTAALVALKKWHRLRMPPDVSPDESLGILHICARVATLRADPDGHLEAFCTNADEANRIEAAIQLAVSDQRLRKEIRARSSTRIAEIVDGVSREQRRQNELSASSLAVSV